MKKISFQLIQNFAANRKAGYIEACKLFGKLTVIKGVEKLVFEDDKYKQIAKDFALEKPTVSFTNPFIPGLHRTDAEQQACKSKCEGCVNYKKPNCCRIIPNCGGGLPLWWRNKNSHCPLPQPLW
jgi:hypothetical protein